MNELVACIGNDSGKAHVEKLIGSFDWDNIILVRIENAEIKTGKKHTTIAANPKNNSEQLSEELRRELKKHIKGAQIGINFFSGNGKLHMAAVSALLKLGVGIRLVVLTPDGIKEI